MSLSDPRNTPSIGLAYSDYVPRFLKSHYDLFDYVEIPFELLVSDTTPLALRELKPIILHCASLSIAGFRPPPMSTVSLVQRFIDQTSTPWLGEHLAFVAADREVAGPVADEVYPGQAFNIGYSVNPAANHETLCRVTRAIQFCQKTFGVPLLLENSPVYFVPPGSTMSQHAFLSEICRMTDVNLLLDLSHLFITANMSEADPRDLLDQLPLDRVVEVHISGATYEGGAYWDDHTQCANDIIFEMLAAISRRGHLRAVTLEYNWSNQFSPDLLIQEIARTRQSISAPLTR